MKINELKKKMHNVHIVHKSFVRKCEKTVPLELDLPTSTRHNANNTEPLTTKLTIHQIQPVFFAEM